MTKVKIVAETVPFIEGVSTLEQFIAYAARVSNPANQLNNDTAPKLLKYLAKNHHWSPFEMASITMEIVTTRDIARQILRHRSFSFQEFSQRYAVASTEFVRSEARLQDTKNRQNSIEVQDAALQELWDDLQKQVTDKCSYAYAVALENGIAKEVARKVLPEGLTESTLYMAGTVRSWLHFIQLRRANGTQKEHQVVALAAEKELISRYPTIGELLA
jgi:thymidylate synthase (FAD)